MEDQKCKAKEAATVENTAKPPEKIEEEIKTSQKAYFKCDVCGNTFKKACQHKASRTKLQSL